MVVFGFLFVTVSSRLTGQIGSSSNPISGMTVATLLFTSLIFLALGWVDPIYRVTALSVAAVVCVAASNAGTTSQDLKTGFLVGATPKSQQIALIIGAITSAIVIGYTLEVLNDASTIYSKKAVPAGVQVENVASLTETQKAPHDDTTYKILRITDQATSGPLAKLQPGKYLVADSGLVTYLVDPGINGVLKARDDGGTVQKYEAPKARLMSLIIDGILSQKLPWGLVLLGVAITFVLELCAIPSLPFAVGVYLPLAVSMPIFIGGGVRWLVERFTARKGHKQTEEEKETGPGILFSSGLIAGGSIAGIGLAILFVKEGWADKLNIGAKYPWLLESNLLAVTLFTLMALVLFKTGISRAKKA